MTAWKWINRLRPACVAIMVLGSQVPLHAAAISIISSSITVHGKAGANIYSGSNNGNAIGTTGPPFALSQWTASSAGSITTTGATLNAVSELVDGNGDSYWIAGYSEVTLTCVFQPLSPNIIFNFTGSTGYRNFESYIDFTLKDLTTPANLRSARWAYDGFWTQDALPYTANLSLNVGHEYELFMLARSTIGDQRRGFANLNLQIVPEPSSAALVVMGLAGLVFRRSRKPA